MYCHAHFIQNMSTTKYGGDTTLIFSFSSPKPHHDFAGSGWKMAEDVSSNIAERLENIKTFVKNYQRLWKTQIIPLENAWKGDTGI